MGEDFCRLAGSGPSAVAATSRQPHASDSRRACRGQRLVYYDTYRERERERVDMGASTFGLHACLLRSLGCKQLSNLTFAAPVYTQRKSISSMQCMRDHEVIAVRGARGS
ncbi:hypothetical protein B296_00031274 [Ensete ventricosum]|uniref:Uncharacterized protein n=1 Tax=Ensete ventricosum TaxID=4639 RepID=A0A426XHS4_ENSVE|nr:hypothetical protein B296_00031274 [Ensete ventricosum]